ncbi:unnamed protein product [marine sediment metagenome]|uniref:Uncharacterized protein n=1 Tax=marine sediment metagenome TaxID=412755 RepID=X0TXW1_9ZZZZ
MEKQILNKFELFEKIKDIELFEVNPSQPQELTISRLLGVVKNFKLLKNYHEVPITILGYSEDQTSVKPIDEPPAVGWITELRIVGNKLLCDLKNVPQKITPLLKNKVYKNKSLEIYINFSFKGSKLGPVLRRVAFYR